MTPPTKQSLEQAREVEKRISRDWSLGQKPEQRAEIIAHALDAAREDERQRLRFEVHKLGDSFSSGNNNALRRAFLHILGEAVSDE